MYKKNKQRAYERYRKVRNATTKWGAKEKSRICYPNIERKKILRGIKKSFVILGHQ